MSKVCSECKETKDISLYYKGRKQCKECCKYKYKYKCIHGKTKYQCRECGGSAYCIHDKIKSTCRICGGSAYCIHDIQKATCRECGGSAFCIHDIQKGKCRECGGGSYCIHDIQKSQCRECGGSAFCIHDIQKIYCRECGGSAYCIHDKIKKQCRECGGSQICIHDKIKAICRECGGSAFCIHDIQKTHCRECGGSAFCIHGKTKSQCRECGGSAYCIHDKIKHSCIICNPECACTNCKSVLVDKKTNCYPLCQACFCNEYPDHEKSTLYKIKERYLRDELRLRFPENNINMIFDKAVDGGCSKKRPDVLIDLLLYSIIIECDENQHKNYECENKRTMQLFEDLGNRPLILIRFNPDSYTEDLGSSTENKKKIKGCFKPLTKIEDIHKKKFYEINKKEWKRRVDILEEIIRENMSEDIPKKEVKEIKLFYDE